MPDIYVMNAAPALGLALLFLGTGICVAFVTIVEKVVKWKRR